MVKIKIKKTINPAIEAEEGKRFWLQDGRILKSVEELAEALEEMSQSKPLLKKQRNSNPR